MEFSKQLLQWYDKNKRILPWRDINDPYKTWLSEIMLQQTQIETMTRYYERFLKRFPDVFALADASIDEVLKLWEGLGYYSRARNLHRCAQKIVESGGEFPSTRAELEKLPGIGKYTACAITSIAFNKAEPALDGNQMRVLSRVLGISRVLNTPFDIESEATIILDKDRPGDYNQALMDLGARICIPRAPLCEDCPVNKHCRAYKTDDPERYPCRPAPIPKRELNKTILVIHTPNGICVRKRKDRLLNGLYEFPSIDDKVELSDLPKHLETIGVCGVHSISPLPPSKHVFTHLIWHMTGYSVTADTPANGFLEADRETITTLAFPGALRVYREAADDLLTAVFPS